MHSRKTSGSSLTGTQKNEVRFVSLADIRWRMPNVRFTPKNGHARRWLPDAKCIVSVSEKQESVCPFCNKPHPPKRISKERMEAYRQDKQEATRPYRAGHFRGMHNR